MISDEPHHQALDLNQLQLLCEVNHVALGCKILESNLILYSQSTSHLIPVWILY